MQQYITKTKDKDSITICLYIEQDKIMAIGEKLNAINENAYMNGYNWEVLINYYLEKTNSDLLDGLDTDPEAGMYVAFYESNKKNETKADKLITLIENLIENESELYAFVEKYGDDIEWD